MTDADGSLRCGTHWVATPKPQGVVCWSSREARSRTGSQPCQRFPGPRSGLEASEPPELQGQGRAAKRQPRSKVIQNQEIGYFLSF